MSADPSHDLPSCWAIIPAAGVGARMQADRPKQYLELHGRTVIEHSLMRLSAHPAVKGVVVALSADDGDWPSLNIHLDKFLWTVAGGAERCHSVLNALTCLQQHAAQEDWVLVHDAARPCVRLTDIDRLIGAVVKHGGGLLAMPVKDTMKRADADGRVAETVDRDGLWHALTPQMFRLGELHAALTAAMNAGALVTDEASAMERAGQRPLLVTGHSDNIKITRPEDLALADFYLHQQESEQA